MPGSAPSGPAAMPRRLADAGLPPRPRALAHGLLQHAAEEQERWLNSACDEFELAMFRQIDTARNTDLQRRGAQVLERARQRRPQFIGQYLEALEASVARLRTAEPARVEVLKPQSLSLVEDIQIEEETALREAAHRAEVRCSMPLFLLGQRFGVLAGRPAFDSEALPLGPRALCNALREAVATLDLEVPHQVLLFRQFDRQMSVFCSSFYDALNQHLIEQGVLPNMTYVPVRVRPRAQPRKADGATPPPRPEVEQQTATSAQPDGPAAAGRPAQAEPADTAPAGAAQPATATPAAPTPGSARSAPVDRPATPTVEPEPDETEFFDTLRRLMAGKRSVLGKLSQGQSAAAAKPQKVAEPPQVQSALARLQGSSPATVRAGERTVARSIHHLKQDLLSELRSSAGGAAALREEDNDAIDLVGLLFDQIMKDVRPNTVAATLLAKLQVPLLRAALGDHAFFGRSDHPARKLLGAVAEATSFWSNDDEVDRDLAGRIGTVVDRVGKEYNGDPRVLERLAGDLGEQIAMQARKAEIAERRHVEAARGREKLESARMLAAKALDARLAGKRLPRFLRTLIEQTWSDVLSLSALRGGEHSDAFRHQLRIAERLIDSAVSQRTSGVPLIGPAESQSLREEIEQALAQVGYHADDARAVAMRLLTSGDEEDDDPASRTELALKIKQRARFGQTAQSQVEGEGISADALDAAGKEALAKLQRLAFGSWVEMREGDRPDPLRRRISWYSPLTGHCLLVNHRGQRVAETTLTWLAREISEGRCRVLDSHPGGVAERAWNRILESLRSFGKSGEDR